DKLRRALGEQAVQDLHRLKEIERTLEEAGILSRNRGRLELTARGARRLGERALVKVFEDLTRERPGSHDSREQGGLAEPTGQTRKWMFGDTGQIAVQKSIFNAVLRQTGEGRASEKLQMDAEDFELIEAETRTRTATALLLDLSYSMPLRGNWIPAKKMALALHALIQGKYPSDRLYLIGFSDYARKLEPSDLTGAGVDPVYGTNMQHAFLLARRLLNEHPRATRQVIMVTDGEPTAHLLDNGEYVFSWPPVPETITKTLAEAMRLSSAGITLNVFMLEDAPGLVSFMDKLAKLTGGRVFHTSSESLGHFVLRDFVRHHR
ncbi:MAG: vWA domain-containing protein, partial [Acidimicrobiia bacterium]